MTRATRKTALIAVALAATLAALVTASASIYAAPSEIGEWSAPVSWPLVAVHMSLEPTGEVFALDGFGDALNSERLWNPSTGTFRSVPYGRNLFCSGHVQLPDGRTLIAGGHISAYQGLADTTLYNAATNTYFRGADMAEPRWYPTVTQLPDGRVLAFAGDRIVQNRPGALPPFSDASVNSLPELYDPQTNTWTSLTSAELTSPLYPYLFVTSDGRIVNVGPDLTTRVLTPGAWTWSTVATSPFDGHSAVMYRPNKIMKAGSWADPDFSGPLSYATHGRTTVIDMGAATPAWRETAPMANGRAYHNLTLLPDGTVLASGGGSRSDGVDDANSVLPAEIWNPDTETWTTVASLTNGRLYHSTALLLPDGRVLMAGGGALPGSTAINQRNAEIYSPPYLFKGPRPTISAAPTTMEYGSAFDVTTPNAAAIAKVSLIRSPSVTHALDMNQRFQFLEFTAGAGSLTVTAPATANLAPPGDYMLFVIDTNGVPSVASFVRISSAGDTTAPTAPSGLTATGTLGQVSLAWGVSSDAGGVARYSVHRSTTAGFTPSAANRIAQPTSTSYVDTGLVGGTYYYRVTAEDVAGNTGPPSNEATGVVPSGPPVGLVAAYGFDEGSGTTTADQTGGGNNGALADTSWSTAGRYGNALSFNGTSSMVTIPDANALDLTSGMTIEGWVRPVVTDDWRTLIVKERPGDLVYGLYSSTNENVPQSQVTIGGSARLLDGVAQVPAGSWTHVAATYDGSAQRLYVNGTQVASLALTGPIATSSSPVRIGGNTIWAEWFNGLIDEVRIYNRALGAAEIQSDMANAISAPDAQPPTAPGTLVATGGLGQVALSWGAAADNVGVVRYNLHRGTTPGFTPSVVNRIAQPTGTSYADTGLAAGTYYYRVTAEDAAGNTSAAGNEASGTATADTTAPTTPATLTATAAPGQVSLSWSASSDTGGIAHYNLHRSTVSGFTPSAGNRIAQPTGTSYADSGLASGTFFYRVTATDPAGNTSAASPEAGASVPTGPPPGLVGEWGFDAGAGTTAADTSGNTNTGTLGGATWTTSGRFGRALAFDGVNDFVTVADAGSLDLTNGMTLEAWVRPTALGNAWRTTLMKERTGSISYALYANGSGGSKVPTGEIFTTTYRDTGAGAALPLNTWTHIATTYNGSALTVYVNGVQAGQLLTTGSIAVGTGPLRFGGNSIWGEWFQGEIDEVRVYNRALGAAEIQADMTRPVTNPDTVAPSAPGTLAATGTLTGAQLIWGAATDNTAVTRYNVHRSTTAAFTPSAANRIAQPAGTSYTDTAAAGTYYYRVTAEDAVGNIGPPSNEASAQVGDATAPGAPGTLTATGAIGQASLSWGAASDNVGVIRYNVHRGADASFVPSAANRIAQPTGTSYLDTVAPGTYAYKVTAEDAAGNVGPASNAATATVTADTSAPTAPTGLAGSATGGTANLAWTASTDNVAVARYNVHRSTTPTFTPSAANRIAQPTGTTHPDAGLSAGTYYYRVTAEDAAGNVSGTSNEHTVTVADATPPSAPTGAGASAAGSTINVSWTAAADNIGVARYNVHRGATSGFTPSLANRIAQPTGTSFADVGLAPGTYFYKVTAEDVAGNVGPASNAASATVLDTTAPAAPTGLSATGGAGQATLGWTAATDNVGVVRYNVHRSTTAGFTPSAANRIAQPIGTSYTDTGLAAGTYHYRVTAEDAAGNVGAASAQATTSVSAPPAVGLVAAYGFDEGTGTSAADQSGSGNPGTVNGATWTNSGRFGKALTFDGVNDQITVADANSLDLTNGMTVEAWVRPSALGNAWRTAVMKEQPGGVTYSLYAAGTPGTKVPVGEIYVSGFREATGTAAIPVGAWTHLATTYDGSVLAVYVNGVQAGQLLFSGAMAPSTGALRIGGNSIWGEWFQGEIDEVRVYNRARTASELQTDMNTSISTPDTEPPTAPAALNATGGIGSASLTWPAASDNVGVVRYNVHRSTTAGFTPTAANRIAQPATTSFNDAGLGAGTYRYRVVAEDAVGNLSASSPEASATVTADSSAPTAPATLNATPAPGQVALSWSASTDNVGVANYNVHRSTTSGFTPSLANRIAQPAGTSYADTGRAAGTYFYSVIAADPTGNLSSPSPQASATVTAAPPVGLVGAYGFDEGSGATVADASGRGNAGSVTGATWTIGRFGTALSFDGVNDSVSIPDASSLDLTAGMTLEAWVRPRSLGATWRTVVLKEQPGQYTYALYGSTGTSRPSANAVAGGSDHDLRGPSTLPLNTWTHLAATYDGATLRLFVNGAVVASEAAAGSLTTSSGALKIGGNSLWPEFFDGLIDEVRLYSRALTQSEIQTDMNQGAGIDSRDPTVVDVSPDVGATGVVIGERVQATFSEAMSPTSITTSTVQVLDGGTPVPATVAYDADTAVATLTPTGGLVYGRTYTGRIHGGSSGVKDMSGRALAADFQWTFTAESAPPPLALIASTTNPYSLYAGEILRAEGFSFAEVDTSFLSPALLGFYDTLLLGDVALTPSQVTVLSDWVNAGGNLIALSPDKQLASLLGLVDANATLQSGYVKVNTATAAGAGIVSDTVQFHGAADRYTLGAGTTPIATLYTTATSATANPAVTLRSVGGSGGQAAAFTYDLSRSIALTRQGNPAWVGQERDGVVGIRPDDLFYGASASDPQPDWLDISKIGIPQADEQQRLLANLIATMNLDGEPVPRFWYLPRGEKAAVVMTGDDHAFGGTATRFDQYEAASPFGCSVEEWDCVRGTSYIYPATPLTNAQATSYASRGFEVSVHVTVSGSLACTDWTPTSLTNAYTSQLQQFRAKYTGVPSPRTHRLHCVGWADWATQPKVELANGIRLDTNYYHYPAGWIGSRPGFMTGSATVMRFADTDGTPIDVFQAHTHMDDEASQPYPQTVDFLLDAALGPQQYYGVFTANMHTDQGLSTGSDSIVASAQARDVPVVTAEQMLRWVDGRDRSSFSGMWWSGSSLTFSVTRAADANGLTAMVPTLSSAGTLSSLTRSGSSVPFTTRVVKGISYALFTADSGTYVATYAP